MTGAAAPGRPRALLVDVGGVLFGPDVGAVTDVLRTSGLDEVDETDVARAHYLAQVSVDEARDRRRYAPAYVAALARGRRTGSDLVERLFADDRPRQPWVRQEPAVAALARVASQGHRLGIVSNAGGDLEELLRRAVVCQRGKGPGVRVDVIVDSGAVGVRKPDPRIFEIAVRRLGLAPGSVAHVGDSVLLDVEPARAAGLIAVHYDPFGVCPARSDHPHVRSLTPLACVRR